MLNVSRNKFKKYNRDTDNRLEGTEESPEGIHTEHITQIPILHLR